MEAPELGITKPKWRHFLVARSKPFQEKGFKIEEREGCLFWPIRLEQEGLVKAFDEDSLDAVLRPFSEKLEMITKLVSIFDKIISDAKKEQQEVTVTESRYVWL